MTNATPGWYPDPWNPSAQRFWDGGQWTDHVATANAQAVRQRLPEGAPIYGPLIWILALLPLVGGLAVWFVHVETGPFIDYINQVQQATDAGQTTPVAPPDALAFLGPAYWLSTVLGWASIAASIVLAYFDWKRLTRIGVVRPFHWGFAFFALVATIGVYVIGRSVIVRRVAAPRGLAPIWVFIAASVGSLISVGIWLGSWLGPFLQQLTDTVNNLPTT
ncbi:DUF2510 domain-containing protein [Gryllotalpicola protaetiae]|uniref:DUF2510 domain-containing protein n=1 Tax=Gryllotalpicola protaetiae TaxID=2419771 RepID=A0A387BPC2_9MICO|nr:DUF2510 domain-containing protein [Gryllotalpicola protaetiae]AYG04332.1 DUF2510 domain-containing protein [Gryllotalpicola protaetiae]